MKYTVTFDDITSTVYGHEPDEYISSYLNKGSFYEEPLLRYIHDKYKGAFSIVDVGSNVGNHAVFFRDVMGVEEITCFEPNPENYRRLKKSAPFADTCNAALSDADGYVASISQPNNMGASYCAEGTEIPCRPLDWFDLSPDIIKIDAENMECQVLKGALGTIERSEPYMFVEHNDIQKFYEFNRILQKNNLKYLVKPFVTETWEMFEYIPQ